MTLGKGFIGDYHLRRVSGCGCEDQAAASKQGGRCSDYMLGSGKETAQPRFLVDTPSYMSPWRSATFKKGSSILVETKKVAALWLAGTSASAEKRRQDVDGVVVRTVSPPPTPGPIVMRGASTEAVGRIHVVMIVLHGFVAIIVNTLLDLICKIFPHRDLSDHLFKSHYRFKS